MNTTDGSNAEVLLVREDGSIIVQVRDDKPGISNPGYISTFGGHIEEGEDPLDAAVREINEETNLNITKEQLQFYGTRQKTKLIHGEDWTVHYFIAKPVSDDGLEVYEGQGYTIIHNVDDLSRMKVTKLLHEVLLEYFLKNNEVS